MHSLFPRRVSAGVVLALLAALTAATTACSPTLDWREIKPAQGGALSFALPCKPTVQERAVQLAGQRVALSLQACAAGGVTWGLATADLQDPARVGAALAELASAAAANVQGQATTDRPAQVPGATPNAGSRHLLVNGRQPGGQPLVMQLAVFAHGTRVYQATALGERVSADAADTFFGALRIQAP